MIRLRKRDLRFKGAITVFVSLVFMLILSLVGALLSSAAFYNRKSNVRSKMGIGLESVFAEYHENLLKEYDIFARADCDEGVLERRLQYYGVTNTGQKIIKSEFLTDDSGIPYYQGAIRYMKDWLGYGTDFQKYDYTKLIKDTNVGTLEQETKKNLEDLLSQEEQELLEENNPLAYVQGLKTSLLSSIVMKNQELSKQSVKLNELPSHRKLNEGIGTFENTGKTGGGLEKTFFVEYLFEHFSQATEAKSEGALAYELEYILCGRSRDVENLEGVLQKILLIRMGINYIYLLTDQVRQKEAQTLATVLCTLTTTPELILVVKQALLLAWAYGESIVDLRVLMKQDRVPPVKTSETWQLQLSNLGKIGNGNQVGGEKNAEGGFSYCDYLKGLLLLEDRKNLCMRSLDLIEENLSVQVDQCMTQVVLESSHNLKEGVYDTFQTSFGYQ